MRAGLTQAEAQLAEARKGVAAANQSLQDFRRAGALGPVDRLLPPRPPWPTS